MRLGGQHAAGEDITLDEPARILRIVVELGLVDGNDLKGDASSGAHTAHQRREITLPVFLAYRFEHLDRHDMVHRLVEIAVVAQSQLHAVRQAGRLDAAPGEIELLLRQGDTCHTHPAACRVLGETAPAAPDLQDMLARLRIDLVQHALVLAFLSLDQRPAPVEQGGRVGHG